MSYVPGRWWLGLMPLGIFWVLGTASTTGDVEADLTSRSKAALGADLVDKPAVEVGGRDVTLGGEAFVADGRSSAIDAVRSQYGVRLVRGDGVGLIAEAKPYVWSADRDGAKVALGGSVPDPAARTAVNASAKSIAGAEVADGMGYARGQSAALAAGSTFALGELGRFSKGTASLSDGALTLSGLASDFPNYEQALAALKTPPAGVTIAKAEITPPLAKPFVFSAANADGSLKLTGVAPSYASRDAIAAASAGLFPHAKIENALTIASGAPKGDFDAGAKFALAELGRFSKGSATLTDGALTLSGLAAGPDAYERALSGLKTPPEGVTVGKAEITPPLAKPFVFAAASGGGAVRLAGAAPSLASRDAIAALAAKTFPGATIDNALTIASGGPEGDFEGAVRFALASMADLDGARATLADKSLSVSGKARAPGAIEAFEKSVSGLAPGFTVDNVDIVPATARPFVFSASSAPGKVTLSGVTPSSASRDAIAAAAAKLFPGASIDNGLLIARGAPRGDFDNTAIFALSQIANLDEGRAVLTDTALAISGKARAPGAIEAFDKAASGLAPGFTADDDIVPATARPFVFSASSAPGKVTLSGVTPSSASRDAIAAAAAKLFPGASIDNGLLIARGAPRGDFDNTAIFALSQIASLDDGNAVLTDTSLAISGKERAPGAIEAFDKAASGLAPGFAVEKDIVPATVHPFVFSASSSAGKVTLSGETPSLASRDAIAAAAAKLFPGATIDNGLLIARGAPRGDFDNAAIFALSQIANLDDGKAVLTDAALAISGKARTPDALEALNKATSTLSSGFTLATADIAPAEVHPYVFAASKSADGIRLTGSVPSAAARRIIETAAQQAAAGMPVDDETKIAAGLPQGVDFDVVAQFALAELTRLAKGEAKLSDSDFSLHGAARDAAGADDANAELGGLLAGVHIVDTKIEAPAAPAPPAAKVDWDNVAADAKLASVGPDLDAPACDAGFKDSLNGATIEFDTDQATISAASYALIVKLAGIALRCQVPQIEIAGYTDNTGDEAINQPLSQARAEAVANVLVKAGVPVSRLSAVGYGASNPIAPNDTEEGRAKNRRIEFEVKS